MWFTGDCSEHRRGRCCREDLRHRFLRCGEICGSGFGILISIQKTERARTFKGAADHFAPKLGHGLQQPRRVEGRGGVRLQADPGTGPFRGGPAAAAAARRGKAT